MKEPNKLREEWRNELHNILGMIAWGKTQSFGYGNPDEKTLEKFVENLLKEDRQRLVEVVEKNIENEPQVDTDFNDGGDDEYRERRITIESSKRSARLGAFREVINLIEEQ